MSVQTQTLSDIACTVPGATDLFNDYNLDFFLNGKQQLKVALANAKIDKAAFLFKLTNLEQAENKSHFNWQTQSPIKLVAHIIDNFHEKHRIQFRQLLHLCKVVQEKNPHKEYFPQHLESHLSQMRYELEEHMMKEEAILFPMIMKGFYPSGPISVMEAEHLEHAAALDKLSELTQQFTPPADADDNWRLLYTQTKQLYNDLKEHIHLENNILFSQR